MQNGTTVVDLAARVQADQEKKRDYVADTRKLWAEGNGDLKLAVSGKGSFPMTQLCHQQVATRLEIPQRYYDKMRTESPELLATNINHWFDAKPQKRMVRTLAGTARAFLSDRYRPLDNLDLMEAVVPVIARQAGLSVMSAEVTDRRLYLQMTTDRRKGEVKQGDIVQAGLMISNSEVGVGSVRVEPLLYRLVCLNGMVSGGAVKRYHIGRSEGGDDDAFEMLRDETRIADDKAFWMKVRDVVSGTLEDDLAFDRAIERARKAAGVKLAGRVEDVVEVTGKKVGLSDDERGSVLRALIDAGDLTQWGLANAITATGRESKDFDRGVELERVGGQVIELDRRDFELN